MSLLTFKRARLVLILFNILFMIFCTALISYGIYCIMNITDISEVIGSQLFLVACYMLIFCALFLLIGCLLSFIAMAKLNRFLLIIQLVVFILFFLLILIASILALAFPDSLSSSAKTYFLSTLRTRFGKSQLYTQAWNATQSIGRCCAVDNLGWEAWKDSYWDRFTNTDEHNVKLEESNFFYKFVPASCCRTLIDPLTGWPTNTYLSLSRCQNWQFGAPRFKTGPQNDAIYYRGCFTAIGSYLEVHSTAIGCVAIFLAILLILGILLTLFLVVTISREAEKKEELQQQKKQQAGLASKKSSQIVKGSRSYMYGSGRQHLLSHQSSVRGGGGTRDSQLSSTADRGNNRQPYEENDQQDERMRSNLH